MMQKPIPMMKPPAGGRLQRFVGDRLRFSLADREGRPLPEGWRARLRTNLGRAELLCKEIIQAHTRKLPLAGASWHDLPMRAEGKDWVLELPLTETGYFSAKAYFIDPQGWQHWPAGSDLGISVHPDSYRTGNIIYCAFTRMFGETKTAVRTENEKLEAQFKQLDQQGYTVIPPSGKFRDLIKELPHIIDTLGARIIHLLPVNPTPTTFARFGRFGSPYASEDLTGIDPALVEFDRRTTGVDQFRELAYATHLKGARLFLDIVINHTGWGSQLQETHPEWFLRGPDGSFVSPGAWGTTWEDLAELEHCHVPLWDTVAESLLVWCRRGVDGFRCDAGYKVPLPAWKYITARVRQEFPETIFLLEGLGGAWELTENLLTEGGMQWAYSELFQNYSPLEVSGYLDHSLNKCEQVGLLVNYSETHDNERLAQRGREWSLLRNRLCALTSVSGGFGFTCGVEWLAPERVNVHSSRGLAWGNPANLVPELARLNRLLAEHPCFFDGAKLTRLSAPESPVYALRRDSEEGQDSVVVLANTDVKQAQTVIIPAEALRHWGEARFELTGGPLPKAKAAKGGGVEFLLEPGASCCLSSNAEPQGLSGDDYRRARAQTAWAMTAFGQLQPVELIPHLPWRELAEWVDENPGGFLTAISAFDAKPISVNPGGVMALSRASAQDNYS
ncbi:MAG: glgE2, partial [Pedosphaera sp.]|nr:glgE2 [Pedosphaera sp.]